MISSDVRRDVGETLWLGFHGTTPPPALLAAIGDGDVGAVVWFGRNLLRLDNGELDLEAVARANEAFHGAAASGSLPPLIAVDQEGGRVQRIREPATRWPPMMAAADKSPELCERAGEAMARELCAIGFDLDFSPVLDVHSNPQNPVIGDRAFGTDPEAVAERALAFARGLRAGGIIACGKHFPGHGDTSEDSHLALPVLDHDLARLEAVELLPFRRAIAAGVPVMMTAHVVFAALEAGVPATLSAAVIAGLLRERLGFAGVIVSDDLDMKAVADGYAPGDAAVRAIAAGCDALLLCAREDVQRESQASLVRAATDDATFRNRLASAAGRVRALKARHFETAGQRPDWRAVCGAPAHRELAAELAG
ncbi:MAG TPA: beta-N-acetylhexosaminidase [Kofleriaceae bacterium]|nr:beta-N-acetylhexosaminidase [Kofleriaceae bacterium]